MTDATATPTASKVDDLIFICERLSPLLEKENAALADGRGADLGDLLEEKQLLCGAYESRGKAVLEDRSKLAAVDEARCARLLELVKDVEEKIAVNSQRLSIQIEVNRRFFAILAAAARDHAPKSGAYSQKGTIDNGSSPAPTSLPLSINEML